MPQNSSKPQASAADGFKRSLKRTADRTSLSFKLGKVKTSRKAAYTRLGELCYSKHRPRSTDTPEDIETAIASTVEEITELSQEILELELRIKLLKAETKA